MPTFNDLYYTDIGNTALRPEFTTQYDGGLEYTKPLKLDNNAMKGIDLHVKADGYFNQVKDKIIAVPKGNSQYRWQMLNLGYVEIRGCDINAGVTMHFDYGVEWAFNGSYTYQKAQDFTDSSKPEYGGQIAYIPWHSASAMGTLSWAIKGNMGMNLNYSFIYTGERYHTSSNILANYEQPWYTHDLSLRYAVSLKKVRLSATLEVNNVFDQQYDVILNYPMPGRNYKGIVSCEF
jgi:outer membrane receptor protein involved in Fe transport